MASSSVPPKTHRKHFFPLESNPEVFTEFIHKLGVSETLEFQDVLSLDEPDLLAFLPRPAYALVLVFPTTEAYDARVLKEDGDLEPHKATGEEADIVYFKQTINNACGLYAILHAVCNGEARDKQVSKSIIHNIQQEASRLLPGDLALALEDDKGLEQAYAEVAKKGDTEAPANPWDQVDYHYICFVKSHKNNHLYQLDGDRKRPIDLGPMPDSEDALSDKCLDVVRKMIAQEEGNVNFSLMALVPSAA